MRAGQSDNLIAQAPAQPAVFVGLAGAECILRDLMASPTSAIGPGAERLLRERAASGVNVGRELLPLLGGDSSLSVTPGTRPDADA